MLGAQMIEMDPQNDEKIKKYSFQLLKEYTVDSVSSLVGQPAAVSCIHNP